MIVLASQSPRRRELLRLAGIAFDVRPSGVPEIPQPGEPPYLYVERLAREKARAAEASSDDYVLAADTTVVCGGRMLEKPENEAEAAAMLRLLSGRRHEVLTGICVRHGDREWVAVESTRVSFLELSAEDIEDYVRSGEPMDKAGAYAIQGLACRFVDGVEGCFFNVVGLPVSRVCRLLAEAGYRFTRG
jgi:septum formation protein